MPACRPASRKGFALIITIILVAFLVLLLVGLATFTRVETQVASNSQQQAQARQNALMALNIAVGELQKYTGPDQRTTARSDMDKNLAVTTTASGRWLGAYGSGAEAGNYTTTLPSAIATNVVNGADAKGCQAKLLNWLVSGNERTSFNPGTDVSATGRITNAPTQFEFSPSGAVAGLTASSTAMSTNLTVADRGGTARPAQLLVGANSVGISAADYVVAPLREISGQAPGMGTTPVPIGRYAWWVGDEGAKARADLPLPSAAQASNAFVSSPRAAVELMDAVNPSASTSLLSGDMLDPTGTASRYDPANSLLNRLVSLNQLPMTNAAPAAATVLSRVAHYRFHDLSTWSASVLSDTYAGGLKKDLSAILANIAPATHATPHANTDFIFPPENTSGGELGVPTWGLLRSYVQTTTGAGVLTPTPPGMVKIGTNAVPVPTTIGVGPVITYAFVGMSYGVPIDRAPAFDSVGNPIKFAMSPIVVLWNPYTTDLAGTTYEIGFRSVADGRFELQAKNSAASAWGSGNVIHVGDLTTFNGTSDKFMRFIIDNSAGIRAGESLVFTLGKNGEAYVAADTANPLVNEYHPGYHVVRDTGIVIGTTQITPPAAPPVPETLNPGAIYRVAVKGGSLNRTQEDIPNTFFSSTTANFGGQEPNEVYLGKPGVAPPDNFNTNHPYNLGFASRQWYQIVGNLKPPVDANPYGVNPGYPTYFDSTKPPDGLFRSETQITGIALPMFRMGFFMGFKEGRDRWLAQSNPRALMTSAGNFIHSPIDNGNWPTSITVMSATTPGQPGPTPHAHAGMNLKYTGSATPVEAKLFEFRPADQPLLSIGQLQHANLSWSSDSASYAIGNSLLPANQPAVPGQVHHTSPVDAYNKPPGTLFSRFYDYSWLLNRALWDRYFVSTAPHKGTGLAADNSTTDVPDDFMRNPRLQRRDGFSDDAILRDADRAASALMLKGGFNINSTSEQAWRAVLGGINQLVYDPVDGSTDTPTDKRKAVLSRFSRPGTAAPATINAANAWSGYRELDEAQIATLARNIVAEIRSRGPFISLADFINRRLKDTNAFPMANDKRLKGTIQAAIDATTVDDALAGIKAINNQNTVPFDAGTTPLVTNNYANPSTITNAAKTGQAAGGTAARVAPYSSPSAFAPQFLTQADVLSAIGAGLSARSDTFTVRTYGEVINPAVGSTEIVARAWCEAVVQRIPEYADPVASNAYSAPSAGTNANFGRRYRIVSFRWLSPDDI